LFNVQVAEEFSSMHPSCTVHLRDVWPRSRILDKASELAARNTDLQLLMNGLQDQWNEGAENLYFLKQNISVIWF